MLSPDRLTAIRAALTDSVWIYVGLMTFIVTVAAVLAWFEKTIPAVLLAVVSLAPGFMLYDMYRNAPPIIPEPPEGAPEQ